MDGIIAIWKPEGWTSHDVVAKTRRILSTKRIGHAGTLDPMVTGVLPLCVGRSTRVVEYMQDRPKAYEATLRLGIATDTEDISGEIIEQAEVEGITEAMIADVLQSFIGEIDQVPPMYSAVKVDGKRLYELAREGKTIERKSRKVTIHHIELNACSLQGEQPEFTFTVQCSKGTYIRTLCVDIGKALGFPATMAALTRTVSSGIRKEQCVTLEQLEELKLSGELSAKLISSADAVDHLPKCIVKSNKRIFALQGQKLYWSDVTGHSMLEDKSLIRLFDEEDLFIGIFEIDAEKNLVKPIKVFS